MPPSCHVGGGTRECVASTRVYKQPFPLRSSSAGCRRQCSAIDAHDAVSSAKSRAGGVRAHSSCRSKCGAWPASTTCAGSVGPPATRIQDTRSGYDARYGAAASSMSPIDRTHPNSLGITGPLEHTPAPTSANATIPGDLQSGWLVPGRGRGTPSENSEQLLVSKANRDIAAATLIQGWWRLHARVFKSSKTCTSRMLQLSLISARDDSATSSANMPEAAGQLHKSNCVPSAAETLADGEGLYAREAQVTSAATAVKSAQRPYCPSRYEDPGTSSAHGESVSQATSRLRALQEEKLQGCTA